MTIRQLWVLLQKLLCSRHLLVRYFHRNIRFTYWSGKNKGEVDLIAEVNNQFIPFEVKYRAQHTGVRNLKGLQEFCQTKSIDHGYVITKSLDDFGLLRLPNINTKIIRIPAPLLCYWMGETEHLPEQDLSSENATSHDEDII